MLRICRDDILGKYFVEVNQTVAHVRSAGKEPQYIDLKARVTFSAEEIQEVVDGDTFQVSLGLS